MGIIDTTTPAKKAQRLSSIDLIKKYKGAMTNTDLGVEKKQKHTGIKKY